MMAGGVCSCRFLINCKIPSLTNA
uniref:Uncharacterized protein n=1 Tax=Anguilla anguilla TaxID=7936 RepID=A0A0E9SDL2_ANGAN